MKVRDTLEIDKIWSTLPDKILNFIHGTEHRYVGNIAAQHYIRDKFPSWQYNGKDKFENILFWCEATLGNNYVWNFETIYFKAEKYKALFLLKWS